MGSLPLYGGTFAQSYSVSNICSPREGCNGIVDKIPLTEDGDNTRDSVDRNFRAGLPVVVSEILEVKDAMTWEMFPRYHSNF